MSSDFEEAKNVDTTGTNIMPNTRYVSASLRVVAGPAVSWVLPGAKACLAKGTRLTAAASAAAGLKRVRFELDGRAAGAGKLADGLWTARLAARPAKGRHVLTAVAVDRRGTSAAARQTISSCR